MFFLSTIEVLLGHIGLLSGIQAKQCSVFSAFICFYLEEKVKKTKLLNSKENSKSP